VTARRAATVALVLGFLAALVHLGDARDAAGVSGRSEEERRLAPLRSVDLDPRLFVAAEKLLPPGAVYTVISGGGVDVSTPRTLEALRPLAGFWLLPRRQTSFPRAAEWVLSFGGDLTAVGLKYRRIVPVARGMAIGEVAG
jgi:hypothetical protein